MELSKKQRIQEDEYDFPYHYILKRKYHKGIHYFAYLDKVISLLKKYNVSENILDLGCGDGRTTFELAKNFDTISGFDYSQNAIKFAKAFSSKIFYLKLDILTQDIMPYKNKFNAITCIEVIEHIKPQLLGNFLSISIEMLKSNGLLIITTPTINMKLDDKHYQHFSFKKIKKYLPENVEVLDVVYLQNHFFNYIFKFLRGLVANRYWEFNFKVINNFLYKFYYLFVLNSNLSSGERIILVLRKK